VAATRRAGEQQEDTAIMLPLLYVVVAFSLEVLAAAL
jgi:hypothetical protein